MSEILIIGRNAELTSGGLKAKTAQEAQNNNNGNPLKIAPVLAV